MNVIDLLRKDGIEPRLASRSKGGEYHSACPGCGDRSKPDSDRFHVWPEQQGGEGSFWCRGCGNGGDNIEYLMVYHGMNFREASEAVGKEIDDNYRSGNQERYRKQEWKPADIEEGGAEKIELYRKKILKFTNWSHGILLKTPRHQAFLEKRGIGIETIKHFKLGYNPGEDGKKACFRPRSAWGLPPKVMDGQEKRLWLPRGITIPLTTDDDVVRIRIRRPSEDLKEGFSQRYFVVPGARMDRFFASKCGTTNAWIIVETELDAMMIWQAAGDIIGVMAMGTSHAKPDPVCHEKLKNATCILIALDFDQAGAGGWTWWEDQYAVAERWPVPDGKDPGEAFEKGVDVRKWILAGLPPMFQVKEDVAETMKQAKKNEKREELKKNEARRKDLPAGVLELSEILKNHPIQIENTPRRLRIIEPPAWALENDAISRRVSTLVFQDPEVFGFLCGLKPGVLHGSNFLEL